jgi:hypothetical protein
MFGVHGRCLVEYSGRVVLVSVDSRRIKAYVTMIHGGNLKLKSISTCFASYGTCLLAVNITSMTNTNCCEYSIKTPDDGQ